MTENGHTWDFDILVKGYDKRVTCDNDLYAGYEQVLELVVLAANLTPESRVLDIGAGTGNLSEKCAAAGAHVIAMDPSEKMLDEARQKFSNHTNIEFVQAPQPFMEIPLEDCSVDTIVSTYAFHHIHPDFKPASTKEMLRVLKPGGRWVLGDLIFTDSDSETLALQQYSWLEEEYFARIDELQAIMQNFGITIESHQVSPVTWVVWVTKP